MTLSFSGPNCLNFCLISFALGSIFKQYNATSGSTPTKSDDENAKMSAFLLKHSISYLTMGPGIRVLILVTKPVLLGNSSTNSSSSVGNICLEVSSSRGSEVLTLFSSRPELALGFTGSNKVLFFTSPTFTQSMWHLHESN